MASAHPRLRSALTIAGSDSGGGAGIQADLKAFAACGVHGCSAITAITAQSTVGVDAIEPVSPEMIVAQVRAVARDIRIDAVKIGMLGTVATIEAVVRALDELRELADAPVVLDPVMVSESGARLLDDDAREALVRRLLPRITVTTPNLPEARVLAGAAAAADPRAGTDPGVGLRAGARSPAGVGDTGGPDAEDPGEPERLARAIRALGPRCVVVTGGHRAVATDVYFDGDRVAEIAGERYPGGAAHGSGCTHSSVLAARLALGDDPLTAAREARRRAGLAVRDGLAAIGAGPGPVDVLGIAERAASATSGSVT